MKSLIFVLVVMTSGLAMADNNLISTTIGYGAQGTSTLELSPAAYSDPHNVTIHDNMGMVYGVQYQYRLDSGIWLGFLVQTNQTNSITAGIGF